MGGVTKPGSEDHSGADKGPKRELRAGETGLCRQPGAGRHVGASVASPSQIATSAQALPGD